MQYTEMSAQKVCERFRFPGRGWLGLSANEALLQTVQGELFCGRSQIARRLS
jgi:hypothetical protein